MYYWLKLLLATFCLFMPYQRGAILYVSRHENICTNAYKHLAKCHSSSDEETDAKRDLRIQIMVTQ